MQESDVLKLVRFEASQKGWRLWRNNVGAGYLNDGRFVRFGLCNESAAMNRQLKSADLIGIRPRVITSADIGGTIGQFVAIECKGATTRIEPAQRRFLDLVESLGGLAFVSRGEIL